MSNPTSPDHLQDPAVILPSIPRRPKRSVSQASLTSLPTPPRTISKRKRTRSRASSVADSDNDSDCSVSSRHTTNKKRRILDSVKEDEEEAAFWTTSGPSAPVEQKKEEKSTEVKTTRVVTIEREISPEPSPRRRTGLASPPPSRRQPARKVKKPATPKSSPSKPVSKGKAKAKPGKELPVRDSPNNPFLDDDNEDLAVLAPPRFKTPPRKVVPIEERKTITYVFRGQKQEMTNHLYQYKPPAASQLPPEHPDFSPALDCPPKLLFPEAHRKRRQPPRALKRGRSPSPDDLSDDEPLELEKITPMAKLTVIREETSLDIASTSSRLEAGKSKPASPAKR